MRDTYRNLNIAVADRIALITIDRPEVRNALDRATSAELAQAMDELDADAEVGVLILTGAGDKAFVSGTDIRDLQKRTKREALQAVNSRLFALIENLEKPVIAAVNGYALGGGCELAIACDLRIASDNAHFGFPETGLGIIPGAGGTQRLPRLVGFGRAKELLLTGDVIDAREAERIGLVNRVVPPEHLLEEARAVAHRILTRGPLAVRLAKKVANFSREAPLEVGLLMETLAQAICIESRDKAEGMAAFLEKRKPHFRGD